MIVDLSTGFAKEARNMQKNRRSRRRGFTLMEVLLVMAILVILGSLVTVSYINIQKSSNVKAAKAQLDLVSSAVGLYQLDMGRTPPNLEALSEKPADGANNSKYAGPYLKQVLPPDPWGSPYKYEAIDANQYRVWSSGPDGTDGTADDVSLTQSN